MRTTQQAVAGLIIRTVDRIRNVMKNTDGEMEAEKLRSDLELIEGVYPDFNVSEYLQGHMAPVFFGSALNNFGVKELLDCFVKIAPTPQPIQAVEREVNPEEEAFSGFVFKIHANMDPNHRSCIAFVKICSGNCIYGPEKVYS